VNLRSGSCGIFRMRMLERKRVQKELVGVTKKMTNTIIIICIIYIQNLAYDLEI